MGTMRNPRRVPPAPRAASESGVGTPFEILLQRANDTTGPDSTPGRDAGLPSAPGEGAEAAPRGTILLVEEDERLRQTHAGLLANQGWTVLDAPDGFNALLRAGTHRGGVDLLIADIVLPRMSGIELWRRFASARPGTQVLFVASNPGQARRLVGNGPAAPRLLARPFSPTTLLETVRALLAAKTPGVEEPPAVA